MNITYMFGAGASANSLPVITEINRRLDLFLQALSERLTFEPNDQKKIIERDLRWLLEELARHQTIDTLAKKFFLNEKTHDKLETLKRILTVYFIFEQTYFAKEDYIRKNSFREPNDKRYDTFIASIIGTEINEISLPKNISIITWNYDLQFEIAYQGYVEKSIVDIHEIIQAIPSRRSTLPTFRFDENAFSIVRLNGMAGSGSVKKGAEITTPYAFDNISKAKDKIAALIDYYQELSTVGKFENYVSDTDFFNYSWESHAMFQHKVYPNFSNTAVFAGQVMQKTDILVVVGYSFPFFNRVVDHNLMGNLQTGKLKKIFIQDINSKSVESKMRGNYPHLFQENLTKGQPNPVEIINVEYFDQFPIPIEFGYLI